jgi:hypothetical protein
VGLFAFVDLLKKKEVIYLIFVGIKILYIEIGGEE